MTNYFVRNLTDKTLAVHNNYQEIISLTSAALGADRKPISALALNHPGVQQLWAAGDIAVYADDDYDTLIPRSDKPLADVLQEGALASLITDENSVVRTAVDERIQEVGNATYAPVDTLANALVPSPSFLPRKPEYVIANFASGHGWTVSGPWASSNLNDTTQQGWASQVIVGTTDGAGGGCNFQKIGGFTAFDPTGKHMLVFMKVSAPTRVASMIMYLSSDASSSFTNSATWQALGGSGQLMQPNEWFPVIFTADGAGVTGTGPGTAIQAMKIRIADKAGAQPITVSVGGVSQYDRSDKYPNGVVSLCFDDGWASHYTTVKTALSKYRYRASAFPIIELLGTAGYTTEAQFLDLGRAFGWEIGAHSSTLAIHQAGLTSLTGDALKSELLTVRRWLTERGLPSQTLAYPQSLYNPEVLAESRKLFAVARTTDGAQKEVFPPADPMRIRSLSVTTSPAVSLATVKTAVDNAQTYGHHLVLTFHDIVASPTSVNWGSTDFVSLIDYIATKSIAVKPLGEVLSGA